MTGGRFAGRERIKDSSLRVSWNLLQTFSPFRSCRIWPDILHVLQNELKLGTSYFTCSVLTLVFCLPEFTRHVCVCAGVPVPTCCKGGENDSSVPLTDHASHFSGDLRRGLEARWDVEARALGRLFLHKTLHSHHLCRDLEVKATRH